MDDMPQEGQPAPEKPERRLSVVPFKRSELQGEKRIELRERVVNLRLAAKSFRKIAEEVGHSEGTVKRLIEEALDPVLGESIEECRQRDLLALDAMQEALWDKAIGANGGKVSVGAVDRVLLIMQRRSQLMGTNVPPRKSDDPREQLAQLLGCSVKDLPKRMQGAQVKMKRTTSEATATFELPAPTEEPEAIEVEPDGNDG